MHINIQAFVDIGRENSQKQWERLAPREPRWLPQSSIDAVFEKAWPDSGHESATEQRARVLEYIRAR